MTTNEPIEDEVSIFNQDLPIPNHRLRNAIGWLGFSLPIFVLIGNFILAAIRQPTDNCYTGNWPQSVSGYYYTPMHNTLVAALCLLAVFLVAYQGYDGLDQWITNLAGVGFLGVAFFPTGYYYYNGQHQKVACFQPAWTGYAHQFFAVWSMVFLALMALQFTRMPPANPEQAPPKENSGQAGLRDRWAKAWMDLKPQLRYLRRQLLGECLENRLFRKEAGEAPASNSDEANGAAEAGGTDVANGAAQADGPAEPGSPDARLAKKLVRNKVYRSCARLIIFFVIIGGLQNIPQHTWDSIRAFIHLFFWCEALAVMAFAVSWQVKGQSLFLFECLKDYPMPRKWGFLWRVKAGDPPSTTGADTPS